jgi:hypothetical protein
MLTATVRTTRTNIISTRLKPARAIGLGFERDQARSEGG